MRYKPLGKTGVFVSEICLGAMTFGMGSYAPGIGDVGQESADRVVKAAVDAGVNFIDTANVYSRGASEEITGRAIRNLGLNRDQLIIATKVMGRMGEGVNQNGTSRKHIITEAHASLKRLGTDYIDLYQIHGWDMVTPIEEQLEALDWLVRAGDVRYIGISNWYAWQIMKALGVSERKSLARFQSVQAYYTIAGRELEREIGPLMASEGLGLMVWSPLAGGFLSGKYRAGEKGRRSGFAFPPVDEARGNAVLDALEPIAKAHEVSVAQVALAWLLQRPEVTSIITGANTMAQLTDNLAAVDVSLTSRDIATLDAASTLQPEYPSWIVSFQGQYRRDAAVSGVTASPEN